MNLSKYLEASAEKYPDRTAVRHEGKIVSYRELNIQCNSLAAGLKKMGLAEQDRCVLMMPNSIQSIISYFALAKTGAVTVPVNFLYRTHELMHIFSDSRPKAFIGADPYLDQVRDVLKKTDGTSIRLAVGASGYEDFTEFDSAILADPDFFSYPAKADDTLNILYTSGTTGVSKGVMLTHGNMADEARILARMRGELDPNTVTIGVLPLYHVFGITSVLNVTFYLGLTIELLTHFEPKKVIEIVEEEEQTILFAVPTMYNRLIQEAAGSPPVRSSLRFCVSGGASLPVEFLHRFESLFNTRIYEGYGLTEAPVCVENPYGSKTKHGSIGVPIPEFEAKIVNPDGTLVNQGDSGELLIKGPGVMKGYLNRPEETQETLENGWLHTGDIACKDEDGYIYIVDRIKDLIIRGGYNIYPREIEEIIYQIPEILEVAVLGTPFKDLGEEVTAIVVLKEGVQIEADEIREYVKQRVAPYKYPRIIRFQKDPLSKSGTGKILKKEIRANLK